MSTHQGFYYIADLEHVSIDVKTHEATTTRTVRDIISRQDLNKLIGRIPRLSDGRVYNGRFGLAQNNFCCIRGNVYLIDVKPSTDSHYIYGTSYMQKLPNRPRLS